MTDCLRVPGQRLGSAGCQSRAKHTEHTGVLPAHEMHRQRWGDRLSRDERAHGGAKGFPARAQHRRRTPGAKGITHAVTKTVFQRSHPPRVSRSTAPRMQRSARDPLPPRLEVRLDLVPCRGLAPELEDLVTGHRDEAWPLGCRTARAHRSTESWGRGSPTYWGCTQSKSASTGEGARNARANRPGRT